MDVVCEKQLAVLDVSLLNDSPQCMHVYPAVLALAKNTAGATRWARLLGDSGPDAKALMSSLNVTQVRSRALSPRPHLAVPALKGEP